MGLIIGFVLGALGSFLGIGGGPFNVVILFIFFSMKTKQAAENSIYIILISQISGLIIQCFTGAIPEFSFLILTGMMVCGVLGSEIGSIVNRRISEQIATSLFEGIMLVVMLLCVYNVINLS